jgi:mannose/cellobiose epimerase-like protein (N-acyl-D-glucosamine 2-epimerase family)
MAIQNKHSPVATLDAFIVACMARDDNLCHLILRVRRNSTWKSVKEGAGGMEYELSQNRKASLWDPRFWPANFWTSGVSNTYLYALARAFGDHGCKESLADGFLHYLGQMSRRHPHGEWSGEGICSRASLMVTSFAPSQDRGQELLPLVVARVSPSATGNWQPVS